MKLIIICAIATATLAYEPNGIHGESEHVAGLHNRNPYKYILRSRRSNHICTPGSMKMIDCNGCVCSGSGTTWLCTLIDCLETRPGHKVADDLITRPSETERLIRSKRDTADRECAKEGDVRKSDCSTCYCDSKGFYSLCVSVAQCDIENSVYRTIEMTNPNHDFNLEIYRTTPQLAN